MKVSDIVKATGFSIVTKESTTNKEVEGVFVGDLLSWVMGNGEPSSAWITVQGHLNVIAVAVLREFSCIILADNAPISDETIEKANDENVAILLSRCSAYKTCKIMVNLGL